MINVFHDGPRPLRIDGHRSADEQFERIDWESLDGGRRGFATRTKVFLAGAGLLAVLFAYDFLVLTRQDEIFGRLDPERITWLFVLSLLAFACFVVVPLATGVGLLAGYRGGWTDRILMGYVDIQQTVPSFVVYLVLIFLFHTSLFLVVLVFGLTSWGSAARLVRSEVIQRREEPYVVAARNAGASDLHVIRHHILPNVSSTVVTAVTRQISTLLLAEAAIAYMELNDIMIQSFGETIAYGLRGDWQTVWWPVVFPVAAFSLTVVAFSVFGDALRDVLDPRGDV
ncbi:ABC transporter permease [Halomicrococcus sp. NG-SE-24]|uniref:ABC transporter permease n=1 Tax=Halomicrococcus sp. NG-SE-24 TaxID=3436928 RepID=UPI003D9A0814